MSTSPHGAGGRRPAISIAARGRGIDTARTMGAAQNTIDAESDEGLMLAYAGGSSAAFDRLYARHRGGTYRYLLRHTGNAASAQEMHQDVWLKVVRARDGYAPDARFTTWLYMIARHRLVDHWRSQRGIRFTSLQDEGTDTALDDLGTDDGSATDPLSVTIDAQCGRRLVEALSGIPPAQRDAFLLHVEGGLSLPEIAALTSTSAETVKSRLRYAYKRLRAVLEDLQ